MLIYQKTLLTPLSTILFSSLDIAINENMIEDLVVWIGTVAGILVLLSFVPQIMKAYKTKKMFDVSSYLVILIASRMFLWVVYGVIRSDLIRL